MLFSRSYYRYIPILSLGVVLVAPVLRADQQARIPSQVSDSFYPSDPEKLQEIVDQLLTQASTNKRLSGGLVAALTPHAGYIYSGKIAAEVYSLIKGQRFPTVVILGTGHRYPIETAATLEAGLFETPLGGVKVDIAGTRELQALAPKLVTLPQAYWGEHAIEVQLPFLQRTLRGGFNIIPILMNQENLDTAKELGQALAQFSKTKKILILVSSDLSHYPDKETARLVDTTSLKSLVNEIEGPDYFWLTNRLLMKRGPKELACAYCGEAAVLTAHYAMRLLNAHPRLLAYANSGELPGIQDAGRSVGYAALIWTKNKPQRTQGRALSGEQKMKLLALAREALSKRLLKNEEPKGKLWEDTDFNLPAAVFVTLRRKDVPRRISLRGCIGSLEPDAPLAEAVQIYALKSALDDPRFSPLKAGELDQIAIEISKLTPFRKVATHRAVKPGQGVLIQKETYTGLFLPSVWEEIPDKNKFLSELCEQKAHLPRDCWRDPDVEIKVFDSESFKEE